MGKKDDNHQVIQIHTDIVFDIGCFFQSEEKKISRETGNGKSQKEFWMTQIQQFDVKSTVEQTEKWKRKVNKF